MRRKRIRERVTERDGVSMKNERRKPVRRRTKGIDDDCGRNEDIQGRKEEMQRRKRRRRGRI